MTGIKPDLTILIIAFNPDIGLLHRCLESIETEQQKTASQWEILVLDNASADTSYLGSLPAHVTVFQSNKNMGFGRAVNYLIPKAQGTSTLLLNPDASLDPGAGAAIAALRISPGAIYVGRLHRQGILQVDAYWHWWTATQHRFKRRIWQHQLGELTKDQIPVGKACGGALIANTALLRSLGPFDESFFLYGEDADLTLRARKLGIPAFMIPSIGVSHESAQSMLTHSTLVEKARTDASIRLSDKHLSYMGSLLVRADLLATTLIGAVLGARSSNSRRSRLARLEEIKRWNIRRRRPPFNPANTNERS